MNRKCEWHEWRAWALAQELLPGWPRHALGLVPPDLKGAAVAPEWVRLSANMKNDAKSEETLRAACATALKLYNERMADKLDAALEHQKGLNAAALKPTADWSFTASTSNPPHLGRILKEAREHGVQILKVRCGEASRVFVQDALRRDANLGLAFEWANERESGVITAHEICCTPRSTGEWVVVRYPSDEQRIVDACLKHLQQRREVHVEVLG